MHGDDLVCAMTFAKPRNKNDADYELIRFANKEGTNVIGGASKLMAHFKSIVGTSCKIISYSDRNYSNGDLYRTLGFTHVRTTQAGYRYFKRGHRLESRHKYQKHKLKDFDSYDENKTEFQIMDEEGYMRIYDAGHDLWSMNVHYNGHYTV